MTDISPNPSSDAEAVPPQQPWRFSLRHLFLAIAFLCVVFSLAHYWGWFWTFWLSQTALFLGLGAYAGLSQQRSRPEFMVLGFVGVVEFFAMLLLPAMGTAHEGRERRACLRNLQAIAMAVNAYEAKNGVLPPAYVTDANGKPLYSWRVLILPYLGRSDIYNAMRLDEPWDSSHNRQFANLDLRFFRCPNDKRFNKSADGVTSYVAVVGQGTAWPGATSVRIRDIKDGVAKTAFLVEVAESDINWMEPRDLSFTPAALELNSTPAASASGKHAGGLVCMAFVDGHTQPVRDRADPIIVRALFTIDGGEQINLNDL